MMDKQEQDSKFPSLSGEKSPESSLDETKLMLPTKNAEAVSTQKSNQAVLTMFHVFPKLPIELRQIIWSRAAPPASIYKLGWERYVQVPIYNAVIRAAPAILEACHESREVMLKQSSSKDHPSVAGLFALLD